MAKESGFVVSQRRLKVLLPTRCQARNIEDWPKYQYLYK